MSSDVREQVWFDYPDTDERYLIRHTEPAIADACKNELELIMECLAGWENVLEGGNPVPFSEKSVRKFKSATGGRMRLRWIVDVARSDDHFVNVFDVKKKLIESLYGNKHTGDSTSPTASSAGTNGGR